MSESWAERARSIDWPTADRFRVGLRLLVVALVARPAASKFLTYSDSVAFFDAIGTPLPTVLVVVTGVIEVVAVVLLLVGIRVRLAAASLVPVMLVAILYVGPDWKNLVVLAGSLALVASSSRSVRTLFGNRASG